MELLRLLVALLLPSVLGMLLLAACEPRLARYYRWALLGNGILLGLLCVPLLMRLLDYFTVKITFLNTLIAASAVSIVLLFYTVRRQLRLSSLGSPPLNSGSSQTWEKACIGLLLVLVCGRIAILGLEVLWNPLFPWDATMHWANKARVWYDSAALVPFVSYEEWLALHGRGVFTDYNPGYPATIPLLQVWMVSALGYWHESLLNIPWLMCAAALSLIFYSQALASGTGKLMALCFTYLLLSMPLLNTHIALAGYADIFLASCYGAAVMAFYNWRVSGEKWQAIVCAVFACSCPLIKNEGVLWLASFVPGLLVVYVSPKIIALLVAAAAMSITTLYVLPIPPTAMHTVAELVNPSFNPDALLAIFESFAVGGNWHLFAYFFALLVPIGYIKAGAHRSRYTPLIAVLGTSLALLFCLFLFTVFERGATANTAVGRITLQLVPGLMFLTMLMFREASKEGEEYSLESESAQSVSGGIKANP